MNRNILFAVGLSLFSAIFSAAIHVSVVQAAPEPSFKVTCYPTGHAQDDPIVFPGQAGKSHMHTFYGAHGVNANSNLTSILADPRSQCGSYYDKSDRSAYWIPSLYRNDQLVYKDDGSMNLTVYYQRSGNSSGARIDQAFPQGLRMIAGDMRATTPQDNVWFKCGVTDDFGRQSKLGQSFPTCNADETLVAELKFPDCWNGTSIDSPDHKSHMAYSSSNGSCPASHPVKLPKVTFEAIFWGVNGPASQFRFASGSAYSFHGDIMSGWEPRAFAGLVNNCLNFAAGEIDCNIYNFTDINISGVTQAMIDAQTKWANVAPVTPAPATTTSPQPATPMDHSMMNMSEADHAAMQASAETPEKLPSTGPSVTLVTVIGLGVLSAAYFIYQASRVRLHHAIRDYLRK